MTMTNKNFIHKIVFFLAVPLLANTTGSLIAQQKPLISVAIDSAAILIGEQTKMHITVTSDKGASVLVPIPSDTLMKGIEVLSVLKPDTSLIENDKWVIKQDVLITSFDSALYLLPPALVISGSDTVYSNQVALKVSTVPVDDSDPTKFNDIKQIWNPPFVWADYYPIIYGVLLFLLVLCIIGYVVKRIRSKKPLIPFGKPEPKLPPYEQAILDLNSIKEQKLWQQGRNKEYYTSITDVLRKYIADRFGINAMEMTSHEVLDALHQIEEAKPSLDGLKQILELADFVKFAKMIPLPSESEKSLNGAYLFVDETIKKDVPIEDAAEVSNKE